MHTEWGFRVVRCQSEIATCMRGAADTMCIVSSFGVSPATRRGWAYSSSISLNSGLVQPATVAHAIRQLLVRSPRTRQGWGFSGHTDYELMAACAAASRAIGTRNGLQLT
jgi:hypothetical protein